MKLVCLSIGAALAFGTGAAASPRLADFRALGADDLPIDPRTQRHAALPVTPRSAIEATPHGVAIGRGAAGERGVLLSFTDDLNCLPLFPTRLNNLPSCAVWSGGPITGTNRWLGTTVGGRTKLAGPSD